MRIHRYSWADFHCYISNPDNVSHKIMLRLVGEGSFGQSQKNFFSDTVTVAPKSTMDYQSPILVENSEKYLLKVYVDGRKSSERDQDILIKYINSRDTQIGVLNSSLDISFGSFTQIPRFKKKYFAVNFSERTFPSSWNALQSLDALVVVSPNWRYFSAGQYQALIDYVRQGGTIIWADPSTLFEVAKGPLAELLPVHPIKTRRIEKLECLSKLIPQFTSWKKPVDFVESVPVGDLVYLLKDGDFPVIAWKKYGLGSCRFAAFPIYESVYPKKVVWETLLRMFFRHQKVYSDYTSFQACLDEMTGFSVPKVAVVKKIFGIYFAVLAGVMLLGLFLRKTGIAWLLSFILAIGATYHVYRLASAKSDKTGRLFSAVELRVENSPNMPVEGFYGLFCNTNSKVSIGASSPSASLSSIPPDTSSFLPGGMMLNRGNKKSGKIISKSFEVKRFNGLPALTDMVINASDTRQFKASFSIIGDNLSVKDSPPELIYNKNSMDFKPWKVPANAKFEHAFIIFPSKVYLLNNKNGVLHLDKSDQSLFQSNSIMRSLRSALEKAYKKTSPSVALVSKITKPCLPIPEGAKCQGRLLSIIPVKEKFPTKELMIGPERCVVSAGDTSTRMIISGNSFKDNDINHGHGSYSFRLQLPPVLAPIKVKEVAVKLSYLNPGGNVIAEPLLKIYNAPKAKTKKKTKSKKNKKNRGNTSVKTLEPKEEKSGVFYFRGKDISKVFSSLDGQAYILIESHEKNPALSQSQKIRANRWRIKDIQVTVKGTLPDEWNKNVY